LRWLEAWPCLEAWKWVPGNRGLGEHLTEKGKIECSSRSGFLSSVVLIGVLLVVLVVVMIRVAFFGFGGVESISLQRRGLLSEFGIGLPAVFFSVALFSATFESTLDSLLALAVILLSFRLFVLAWSCWRLLLRVFFEL
jgi:hypothetical protein